VAEQNSVDEAIYNYCHYIDPFLGKSMRLMTDDFVEWEANGAIVKDKRGREFRDGMTFGGVFGLGHLHPNVVNAVKAQLDRMPLSTRCAFNQPLGELGKLLAEVTPGDLRYTFVCSSGTESIEVALKLARLSTERPQIISCHNSFHGMSIACSSVSGIPYWREGFFPLLEMCKQVPYGDIKAMEAAVGDLTAAVLVEPLQANAGCLAPPDGYLRQLRELCDRKGALLLIDEIQTGFGRTGKMFGVDHDGVVPDIMCLGKSLGGGVMAIGAAVFNERVQQANLKRPIFNNTTFGGNPLASSAGIATIRTILDDGLVEHSAKLGERLGEGLQKLRRDFPTLIADLRGRGMMRSFVLRDPKQAFFLSTYLIQQERLLLLSPVHTPTMFRVNPPLIVDEAFIDGIIESTSRGLRKLSQTSAAEIDQMIADVTKKLADLPDL
jgi:putrescine aminotransferase